MASKVYLNKKQRAAVQDWLDRRRGRIAQIRDATCNYREVRVEWKRSIDYVAFGKTAVIHYETVLDLTPSGKIRSETHSQKQVCWLEAKRIASKTQLELLIGEALVLPPPPADVFRRSLYPKDKSQAKLKKPEKLTQYSLPLAGTSAKLSAISLRHSGQVKAEETLWAEEAQYLDFDGRTIQLPKGFINLMMEMQCSVTEFEAIAQFYQVLQPEAVLRIIESIPDMRKQEAFPDFQEPVKVEVEVRQEQKEVQSQRQRVSE